MNGPPLPQLSALMKACADPTRLRIVALLHAGELCVCHLHECLRISQPKASRHLAYLRRVGLVETRRKGAWIYYRLADDRAVKPIMAALVGCVRDCDTARGDLRRLEAANVCAVPLRTVAPTRGSRAEIRKARKRNVAKETARQEAGRVERNVGR